jgi:hypothetical protein
MHHIVVLQLAIAPASARGGAEPRQVGARLRGCRADSCGVHTDFGLGALSRYMRNIVTRLM